MHQRQRQSVSKRSNTLEAIPDHDWSRLLARRQKCKQQFQKIQNSIEDATDRIKQIEQNKRSGNAEAQQHFSSGAHSVLGTVNNSTIRYIKNSLDCPDKATITRDLKMTASKLNPEKSIKVGGIPSRLASLARQQNNDNSPRRKYEGSSSVTSNCSTSSSSSLKYSNDISYQSSRSESVSSTSSSSTPFGSKDNAGKYFSDLNRDIVEARQFSNQSFSLGKDITFSKECERMNVGCVEKQANKNIFENGTFSRKRTSLLSNHSINQNRNSPSYNEVSKAWEKRIPASCHDTFYDPKRPDFISSSISDSFLPHLNPVQLSGIDNSLNASFNPISDTATNKNIRQKHSYNFCGHVKTSEINNRQTIIQDKAAESQKCFTHSLQDNIQDIRANAKKLEKTDNNIAHSFKICTCNKNPKYSHSCNELLGQVSVNNSRVDSNCKTSMNESMIQLPNLQFCDYEIDRTLREDYNCSSFYVRNPREQRANIILSPFHPVVNVCDTTQSIFHCENHFSFLEFDQNNNNIVGVTYYQPETSNMASHIVTKQTFATLCEENENVEGPLHANGTKQLHKENEKGYAPNKHKDSIATGNSTEIVNRSQSSSISSSLTLNPSTISTINCGKRDLLSPGHSILKNTDNMTTHLSVNDMVKNGAIPKGHDTKLTRDSKVDGSSYEKHDSSFSKANSPFSDDDSCSEWEYYSDEECNSFESNLENTGNCNRPCGMTASSPSHLSTRFMHNLVINKKDKGTSDPWSPYLMDITFDISPNRNSKTQRKINQLKEWIEQVSDAKSLEALKALNNDYHQLYPLCTVKRQIPTTVLDSNINTNEITSSEKMKEGIFKEYIKDVESNEFTQMHEINYCHGVRHGFYRVFTIPVQLCGNDFTQFHSIGCFWNDKRIGKRWKWLEGNGYMIDSGEEEYNNEHQEGLYLYPNLTCGIHGKWLDNQMKCGRFCRIISTKPDEYGMPMPDVEFPTNKIEIQNTFHRDLSTTLYISKSPMIRDPYEHQTVYVAKSKQAENAGEGIFAKRMISNESLVALFNGTRQRDPLYSKNMPEFSDYRIALDRCVALDIPDKYKNISTYRATLGHKCCHSFKPNATFVEINHPRFGRIMSVVATEDIPRHGEILVSYNYRICHAPRWYIDLWFKHLRENENMSEEELYQFAKRESRFSGAPLAIPAPPRTSSRFSPCGRCKEHIGIQDASFTCDICDVWHHLSCTRIDLEDFKSYLERKETITCDRCSTFR